VLGFCAALALNREFVGRGLLRGILLVPYVVSAVAAAYVWRWLYHSDFGAIGALSVALGITDQPVTFLDNVNTVLPSLIVVNIWKEFPFAMIFSRVCRRCRTSCFVRRGWTAQGTGTHSGT
jgi:multiple sugar transport system permease protein